MDKVYNNISGSINIDAQRKESSNLYNKLKKIIIDALKTNTEFAGLFREDKLSGSYADGLKISNADEYDLLLRFVFPSKRLIKIQLDKESAGNILINMKEVLRRLQADRSRVELYYLLKKLVDDRGFLLQNKFFSWFQSCFTKNVQNKMNTCYIDNKEYHLQYSTSGPARTIALHDENQTFLLSVDFVPVIVFEKRYALSETKKNSEFWDAIPRPLKDAVQEDNRSFRTSYSDWEREIITDKKSMKVVLKLLKKFRDMKPNMKHLKSYYIKTVFLWLIEKNKSSFWEQPVHALVSVAFKELETALGKKELKFFWHPNLNMLRTIKPTQVRDMHRTVEQAIKTLYERLDQQDIINLFLTAEEQKKIPCDEMKLMSDCLEHEFIQNAEEAADTSDANSTRSLESSHL